jgi:hypothetical protein
MQPVKEYTIDEWLDWELYQSGTIARDLNTNYMMLQNLQREVNDKKERSSSERSRVHSYFSGQMQTAKEGYSIYAAERRQIIEQIKVNI